MSMRIFLFFLLLVGCASKKQICSNVRVIGKESITLTETEERLVCGDKNAEAYKDIPAYQAGYSLVGMLQSRGYLRPQFTYDGDQLVVDIGKKSHLKRVDLLTEPNSPSKKTAREVYRIYSGEVLRPKTLDEMDSLALSLMRQRGYPCAKVQAEVDVETDSGKLGFTQLEKHSFGEFSKETVEGLEPNALDRFYPFKTYDRFNERQLTLHEKRLTRIGVLQGTYFEEKCEDEGRAFSMKQNFIVGPPRTLRFGVGASTEQGPMFRARWSNNRYGPMASILDASLQASFRTQTLLLSADYFLWKDKPRQSLYSTFQITRQSQAEFNETTTQFRPQMKWSRDALSRSWIWTLGPNFQTGIFNTDQSSNTRTYSTIALEGALNSPSHSYEFYDIHPEEGNHFNFNFDLRNPALGFNEPLLKLDSSVVGLKRIANWAKGAAIGGARIGASTTWVPSETDLTILPPSVKFYGGGSNDVRGFTLNTIPTNSGAGALTKLILKLELRRTYFFHESLEGFVFTDQAYFGETSWTLDPSLYYSPGAGLRWLSPIGLVQGYYARGYSTQPTVNKGDFLYLGLGGSF